MAKQLVKKAQFGANFQLKYGGDVQDTEKNLDDVIDNFMIKQNLVEEDIFAKGLNGYKN